jgi:biopolymer transport protein ExbB
MTDIVGLVASIAPMLGLLGTVVGMVGAFDTISAIEGPVRPDNLAGNISEALITTVMGLIVAIPCTAIYTFLRNRIDALVTEIGRRSSSASPPTSSTTRGAPSRPPARPARPAARAPPAPGPQRAAQP